MAEVYTDISSEQLSPISTHSLRVKATSLLNKDGKDKTYIKLRLRWLSNCFNIYLRNTEVIMIQHLAALDPAHLCMVGVIIQESDLPSVDNLSTKVDSIVTMPVT